MVGAAGIEPATTGLEIRCSIQLSYAPLSKIYHKLRLKLFVVAVKSYSASLYSGLLTSGLLTT